MHRVTCLSRRLRKVVVTARPFDSTLEMLRLAADEVVHNPLLKPWSTDELHAHAAEAEALLCFMTDRVDASFLEASPRLRHIACALKGYDNFDVEACSARGIAVTVVPDLLTAPTAELAIALTLGIGRHVVDGDRLVRTGKFCGWRPQLYGVGLAGSTVGLLGFGAVGRAVAARLQGFGVGNLLYSDLHAAPAEIERRWGASRVSEGVEELLSRSDVLIVCTPLTPGTRHLVDQAALQHAKPGLLLVNISRGSCVSEAAVAEALDHGVLRGYAADVFEFEDWALPARPAAIEPRLLTHERTLLSPHLGSAVATVRRQIEHDAAQEIVRLSKGEAPHNRVN
jgi:phosphonate dehydrogenase